MALFFYPKKSPRLTSSPDWEGSVKLRATSPNPTLLCVRREPIDSSLNQMSIFY